jgi:hypothetical protein
MKAVPGDRLIIDGDPSRAAESDRRPAPGWLAAVCCQVDAKRTHCPGVPRLLLIDHPPGGEQANGQQRPDGYR